MASLLSVAFLNPISYRDESSISLAFSKISSILLNSAVTPLWSTSFCRDGLKAAISRLLQEYSSGYCIIRAAYLVKSGIISGPFVFLVQLSRTCWMLVYASMYSGSVSVILRLLLLVTNS